MQLDLTSLYNAFQHNAQETIKTAFDLIDQDTANKHLELVCKHYGYKTFWEPTAFAGWRVMLGQDLADVMYGTRDVMSLGRLLKRYGVDLIDIRASNHNGLTLKAYFSLAKTVSQVSFATWKHFLIAGMKGETEAARGVFSYVLLRETQARIAEVTPQVIDPLELLRRSILTVDGTAHKALQIGQENTGEIHALKDRLVLLKGGLTQVQHEASQANIVAHQTAANLAAYKKDRQYRAMKNVPDWMRNFLHTVTNGHCMRCGKQCRWDVPQRHDDYGEIDHIKRPEPGESADLTKLQLLCVACHTDKTRLENNGVPWWKLDFRPEHVKREAQRIVARRQREKIKKQKDMTLSLFRDQLLDES